MANRCLLHVNKLDAFKYFLEAKGLAYRPGKGEWQRLQILTEDHGWQCVYIRKDIPEHYSIQDNLVPLVREFLRGGA